MLRLWAMLSERSTRHAHDHELETRVAERRAAGAPLLDLTRGDLPWDEPAVLRALGDTALLRHGTDREVDQRARAAIAAHYAALGVPLEPERVVLASGVRQARAMVLAALTDPGDEVLAVTPSRPVLDDLAALLSVHVPRCLRRFDGERWSLDARALWDHTTERTRALWVGSPGDPTGDALDADAVRTLAELGVTAIVEETLACPLDTVGHRDTLSVLAHDEGARLVSIAALDTLAGLAGLGVAWIAVGRDAAMEPLLARLSVLAETLRGPSTMIERAVPGVLASAPVAEGALRLRCRANLAALRRRGLAVPRLDGGWFAPVRLPRAAEASWALTLVDHGVLVTPGVALELPETWIVISLCTPEDELARGADIIAGAIEALAR